MIGLLALCSVQAVAQRNEIKVPTIKTLQVKANGEWGTHAIMELNSADFIEFSFDDLTHEYKRYTYAISHCNADWSPSDLSELDYLNGFNNNPIEEYEPSFNTTMLYTHYSLSIPNDYLSITASGNYKLTVYNDGDTNNPVLHACFSVIEKAVSVSATVSSNTTIDTNTIHQQVSFAINHPGYTIRDPHSEISIQVIQNRRWDSMVTGLLPTYASNGKLQYTNNQKLIFKAGNEYRRFEIIDVHYASMGVEKMLFFDPYYHAELFVDQRRKNYSYDEDQNGRFFIREMQASNHDTEADYLFVHFALDLDQLLPGNIYLQGDFTGNPFSSANEMILKPESGLYENVQLLKQGAYNYQYLHLPRGGKKGETAPIEGDYYETENEYLILIYHRPFGERYDKLVGMCQL